MKAWFDDPKQLIDAGQVTQFWPTREQTPEDRVNAASRFVIYVCCILYLIRRDPRVFVLGATVIGVIYILYKSKMVKEGYGVARMVLRVKCPLWIIPWEMSLLQITRTPLIVWKRATMPV